MQLNVSNSSIVGTPNTKIPIIPTRIIAGKRNSEGFNLTNPPWYRQYLISFVGIV